MQMLSTMSPTVIQQIINQLSGLVMGESTKEYGKSLRKIALDKKLKNISKKDKETLLKIADLMQKEDLGKDADAGDYIDDFRKSDAPQFKGKSDKKIRDMAIAAYLSKKEKK